MSGLDWPGAFVLGSTIGVFGYFLYLVARRPPLLSQIERLQLKPGDIVVLMAPRAVSLASAERLKAQVEQYLQGHKAMILTDGIEVKVLSTDSKGD